MNRLLAAIAALAAAVLMMGCGHTTTRTITRTVPAPVSTQPEGPVLPLETSRTPEGAKPASAPLALALAASLQTHISTNGLHLIEGFEGFSSCPYWDPYGRVWTRGYGETEGIRSGSACIGRSFGESNLRYRVERYYEWAIRGLHAHLNQNQWDALCSFAWNLGAGIFSGSLRADIQHGYYRAAGNIMLQYVHAGGQVLAGLVTRRRAEVALFLRAPAHAARTLGQAVSYRAKLRQLLVIHHCRQPPYHAAKPTSAEHSCHVWLREGAQANREIRAKGGR